MKRLLLSCLAASLLVACKKKDVADTGPAPEPVIMEDASSFTTVATLNIAGTGAAEITAYCERTKRLFVVNNATTLNRVEVVDIANPAAPVVIGHISLGAYNGAANSVAVHDGRLAVALESGVKTNPGRVLLFRTDDYSLLKNIPVGALPDMITFSPDGRYLLTANEAEPNADYSIDPAGGVSIIDLQNGDAVTTLDFGSFGGQLAALRAGGFRTFGPSAGDLAKDAEPEYITVSPDSRSAWVTLQENNAIARIDLSAKTVTALWPLGFKDYSNTANATDLSDQDGGITFAAAPVKGVYMPDAIAVLERNGIPYLFTANEGDAREYTGYTEGRRLGANAHVLDATAFPNAAALKANSSLGRLNVTSSLGDTDGDGDFDALYSFGARSFSVWNGATGSQVFDSRNDLDVRARAAAMYDDARSDDKSVEPEGVTVGRVGTRDILFVGLERADAVALYDVTDPAAPVFVKILAAGDGPEGVLYVPARKSPNGKSLLIVSSENDGNLKIYMPER
ncbi:choice-of-anchor I family protein [Flaviaesturariibacter amylovorans]|uniref:Choice-of-anchor I family protein n=1 Tax=Flaviaesturariibacter amylovorans TaxID=1084520 RepID=A0ABP8GYF5_9BACT